MNKTKIAILGASGRMGQLIAAEVESHPSQELVAAIAHAGSKNLGRDLHGVKISDQLDILSRADVLIDFTNAAAMLDRAAIAVKLKKPFVSGTSGLDAAQMQKLREAAKIIPVFHALNMSQGVFVLNRLLRQAASMLGSDFQVEIVETHHTKKADAPSGTALLFARNIADARGQSESDFCYGREGMVGARPEKQIGIHAVRLPNVVGEHTVHFANDAERLEFTHRAVNRAVFAKGAVAAAQWILGKKPGFYGMADMMGDAQR